MSCFRPVGGGQEMTTGDYSTDEPYFGYLPDAAEALESTLERGAFARALAVDVPVKAVFGGIESCRILWQPEVELPAGLYWFEGVEAGSLVVHVGGGEPPGG